MDLLHRLPEEKCIVVRPGALRSHFPSTKTNQTNSTFKIQIKIQNSKIQSKFKIQIGELIAHFDCQTEDVVLALGGSEFRSAIKQSSEWSFSEQFIDYAVKLQVEMNEN